MIKTIQRYFFKTLFKDFDGLFLSNGPGDPIQCEASINTVRKWINNCTIKPVSFVNKISK